MYWWNVRQLANDFKEERVSERERFKYVLGTWLAFSAVGFFPGRELGTSELVAGVIGVLVTIVGTTLCYRANARGENRDFVARFLCLAWPLGWQMVAVVVAGLIPLMIILWVVSGPPAETMHWSWEAVIGGFGLLMEVVYYIRLRSYISFVAHSDGGTVRPIAPDSVSDAGTLTEIS